jgi:hypothetical protein
MMIANDDPIMTPPTLVGPHGTAWLVDLATAQAKAGIDPVNDATIAEWLVEAPWAHPVWHSYIFVLLHLRPMPDRRETIIYLNGATHELWVYALDPGQARAPALASGQFHYLTPMNFGAQFIEITDELARDRVKGSVKAILAGRLSPDTDYRRAWIALYNDKMLKKDAR